MKCGRHPEREWPYLVRALFKCISLQLVSIGNSIATWYSKWATMVLVAIGFSLNRHGLLGDGLSIETNPE